MTRARLDYTHDAGTLTLKGVLDRGVVRELNQVLTRARPGSGQTLRVDLAAVDEMDSAAVAALIDGWRRAGKAGGALSLGALSASAERSLSMFRLGPDDAEAPPPVTLVEGLGGAVYASKDATVEFLQLAADTLFGVASALRRWRKVRWGALVDQCIYIGSQALPIVGLISFLVGLTLAFQSANQLRRFGASIYVADLISVSVVSEMGPLMTAILVAGRSGSSIAAEIATMKVSEEVDALRVMGIDPIGFLAVPRLLAIGLMVPLLTVLADVLGVFGGFLVGVTYLDLSPIAFLNQALDAVRLYDFMTGLAKSLAFACGIGLIGLFYGFRVRGGAGEVGRTTTASVVASIFYIIVADCIFSVIFYVVL